MIRILDTSAFSAAMRNEVEMNQFLKAHQPGNIATVPPVVAEIEYGIRRIDPSSRKHQLLSEQRNRLLSVMQVLPWNAQSSVCFGKIKAELEQTGQRVDDFDIAIAAIAMSHAAELVTANLIHFRRIDGLTSRHWREE